MMSSPDQLSVLVVDDDPAMLRTTADVLRLRGFVPLPSPSASDAIALAVDRRPAIAIIDLQLPDMDGLDLIGRLQTQSVSTEVIVLTGNASVASAVSALRQSIFDYLVKPVTPVQLGETLSRAAERWHRRRAEAALQATEQRFRSLIEHAADTVLIVDDAGIIRYASPALERTLGPFARSLVGDAVFTLLAPADADPLHDTLERLRAHPELAVPVMLHARAHDGTVRTLSGVGRNLSAMPAIGGYVLNLTDVTEQLALEAQLRQAQKLEAIGRLASGVAHDFNNVLTAIKSYGQLLLGSLADADERRTEVYEIIHASDRAALLTRQLLAFGRQQVVRPRLLDLNDVVENMDRMLQRLLGSEIRLETALADDLPPVRADPTQMEQVVLNLVVNARDAMREGGRIAVRTEPVRREAPRGDDARVPGGAATGAYVLLAVSDTGIGMDEATRARIFEPFFTTKEREKGTGLGLATVYGIVRQAGGFVEVDSSPGAGSTFRVFLPCAEETAEAAGPDAATRAAPAPPPERPAPVGRAARCVLLVEDDETVRLVVRRSLDRLGYRVLEAASGGDALRLWERERARIDILLSDVSMPELSGLELARTIRARDRHVPIVLMSGYTSPATAVHDVDALELSFIEKPFTPDQLDQALRERLGAARPR